MTSEEGLVRRYFEAFNRHDIEGVMACFSEDAVMISANGRRRNGLTEIRRSYESGFSMLPDGRCDLRACTGGNGRAMAESIFRGTGPGGETVRLVGVESIEISGGRIKQIRDYHLQMPSVSNDSAGTGGRICFAPPRARVYR
jgi:hypothetical protein